MCAPCALHDECYFAQAVKLAQDEASKERDELQRRHVAESLKNEALQEDVANLAELKAGFEHDTANLVAKHQKELEGLKAFYERKLQDMAEEPKQASAIADMAHAVEHSSHEVRP